MEASTVISIAGVLVTLVGVVLVFWKGNGENKNQATQNKTAIDERIDDRLSQELVRVYARLDAQDDLIREQAAKISQLEGSERSTKFIVRRWFHDLIAWDRRGRHGEMPLPTADDMQRLDLDPNETTLQKEDLAAPRDQAQ